MRFLTKSRFKQALECPTKLYYGNKRTIEETKDPATPLYADTRNQDAFLLSLAEGGFQVGELSKFYFHDNPIEEQITINTRDYVEAINQTKEMLKKPGKVVIAEAAFTYSGFFVRVDILVKEDDRISIYEVKAKSWNENKDSFFNEKKSKINSKWMPYVYDVAFQRYVVKNALGKDDVKAFLTLVDKTQKSDIDGLNQLFSIEKVDGNTFVKVKKNLKRSDLGQQRLLINKNVDEECWRIENEFDVPTDLGKGIKFTDFIQRCFDAYYHDVKLESVVGKKCKDCQFHNLNNLELNSGFIECWKSKTNLTEEQLREEHLVLELWGGGAGSRSLSGELIKSGKYLLKDVDETDIAPKSTKEYVGLSPLERRLQQINRVKERTSDNYFNKEGFLTEKNDWNFPFHMIDFETSTVALPFFKGMKPYDVMAFQFSHHTIDEAWNIEHKTQYICFEKNTFPNFEFVRELKKAIGNDNGTIFRYHDHENTTLNKIREQLLASHDSDKEDLINFIDSITHGDGREDGERDMVDLFKLVTAYYYSPHAKGSNSIKAILPAIINESDFLRSKYSDNGVYGKELQIKSLNFEDHIWIKNRKANPYKTLPQVFPEYDNDILENVEPIENLRELRDGGAALTAYNYLQYSSVTDLQRQHLRDALYKYCELDTMAMVMIMEAFMDMTKK